MVVTRSNTHGERQDEPFDHEVEIAWDLLNIVSHLHEIHIAHLNIKPTNVLWDTSTQSILVIDFDSSEILQPDGNQKVKGVFGTTGYAVPEAELESDIEFVDRHDVILCHRSVFVIDAYNL